MGILFDQYVFLLARNFHIRHALDGCIGAAGGSWQRLDDPRDCKNHVKIKWIKKTCRPCYRVSMIVSFNDKATEDIFNGVNSKLARKACPQTLWRIASRKLDQLDAVQSLDELKIPPGNRLETLSGDKTGLYSIRINEQYRVCFSWEESGPANVTIIDYH